MGFPPGTEDGDAAEKFDISCNDPAGEDLVDPVKRRAHVPALEWACAGVLSQAWPREKQEFANTASRIAKATVERLRAEGRTQEADAPDALRACFRAHRPGAEPHELGVLAVGATDEERLRFSLNDKTPTCPKFAAPSS